MAPGTPEGDDREITDINVTPLVDVTLVLLIIFMVTASVVFTRSLPVRLPKSSSGQAATRTVWQVAVKRNGSILLNGKPMERAELASRMRSEARVNPSLKVDLAADEGLSYGKVVEVMDMLKQQGVRQLALSVEPR